jgi:dimethylamine monooxygenase subunit A
MARPPLPFLDGTWRVAPDIRPIQRQPLDGTPHARRHIWPDEQAHFYAAEKLQTLQRGRQHCVVRAPNASAADVDEAFLRVFAKAASEHPERFGVDGHLFMHVDSGLQWDLRHHELTERTPLNHAWANLAADIADAIRRAPRHQQVAEFVALLVQEDLVVLRHEPSPAIMEAMHVLFPSAWNPAEKVGRSFAEVHAPVVHSEKLVAAGEELMRTVVQRGPFIRWAWGLHRDGELCHHPVLHQQPEEPIAPTPDQAAAATWLRIERQTFIPMPDIGRAVFTIRTFVEPLQQLADDLNGCAALASAIAGMSDEALVYKGLVQRRDPLVTWLKGRAAVHPDHA